jgi:hypothetical protein
MFAKVTGYMIGERKNQKVRRLARISFISRKWTVKAETKKQNPRVNTYWTSITSGRKRR